MVLLLGTLIMTHTIGSLFMALLLFGSWVAFRVYAHLVKPAKCFPVTIPLLFTGGLLIWWTYDGGSSLETMIDLVNQRFTADYFIIDRFISLPQPDPVMTWTALVDTGTYFLFLFLPLLGMLYFFSRRGTKLLFNLGVIGAVPLATLTLSFLLPIEVMQDRWTFFAALLNGIAMAVTLMLLYGGLAERGVGMKYFALGVLLMLLCPLTGLAIVNSVASTDLEYFMPYSSSSPLSTSELTAATTAREIWGPPVMMDFRFYFTQKWASPETRDFTLHLYENNFSAEEPGLVLIREKIIQAPEFLISQIRIPYYDVDRALISSGFSRVYDTGTVRGYRGMGSADSAINTLE